MRSWIKNSSSTSIITRILQLLNLRRLFGNIFPTIGSVRSVTVIATEMGTVKQVRIMDEAVYISRSANRIFEGFPSNYSSFIYV